uniref:Helicase/UvrB N-terminal domain-containing protein n=1 Tax=viral metagenome TaxID=1070528 RepID=A0A6C0LR35_9ZZZZ
MDLTQSKLSREEWESIETPISNDEKKILKMIIDGFEDVNIRSNDHLTMFSFVKIEITPETELFLFQKYFSEDIKNIVQKYTEPNTLPLFKSNGVQIKKLKSADNIRIQNLENNITQNKQNIFEFLLIDLCKELLKCFKKQQSNYAFYLYTLLQLKKTNIRNINKYVIEFVNQAIEFTSKQTKISNIIQNAYEFIEKNNYLFSYEDLTLFPHQKQLFTTCKQSPEIPKLILYTAPTGTGKTLSPIGLSNQYRIIFVCVARHIGLALAKSAISMEKKVAFAFGCETASDIRLHYFAAVNYVKHNRSGAIAKVDNSEGSKVEIMICDVQSYLTAMYYMLAFNQADNIITYWDEPTITMDYEKHTLHETIHRNWCENKIPKMVLSCATLPKEDEIMDVIADFRCRFNDAEIHTINSYDCKKSIPILNKDGYCVLPHMLYAEYSKLIECVDYCMKNKTLLRYFDLSEIIRFINYINETGNIPEKYSMDLYFTGISDITMDSLKNYYLLLLKQIQEDKWNNIYLYITTTQKRKYKEKSNIKKSTSVDANKKASTTVLTRTLSTANELTTKSSATSGILLTTADAHTLTDGPTIFLTEDVKKIGNFYIQQSNISSTVFQTIIAKISKNNEIAEKIENLESFIREEQSKTFSSDSKTHKSSGLIDKSNSNKDTNAGTSESDRLTNNTQKMMEEINRLRREIRTITLDPIYVPNSKPHQEIWTPTGEVYENAFLANIDDDTTKMIMSLDIDNNLKVLLLLGIGIFMEKPNIHYMEIMKRLADAQRLFIIIASSDYIYGTNYQFSHGFIGKDLMNMTQQKTLQAMGRIGRNKIQQDYTVRFRDDDMIMKLFKEPEHNIEAINMSALFSS